MVGATSRPAQGGPCTWSEPRARPRAVRRSAARQARRGPHTRVRDPPSPRSPGATSPHFPDFFGVRGLFGVGEGEAEEGKEAGIAAAGAQRKWHARTLETEVAEDGGRGCRGSVGDVGESAPGEWGAPAPADCGQARAAPRLRPPHPCAPTLQATGLRSSSHHRCRCRLHRHWEDPAKVWIWGRARR